MTKENYPDNNYISLHDIVNESYSVNKLVTIIVTAVNEFDKWRLYEPNKKLTHSDFLNMFSDRMGLLCHFDLNIIDTVLIDYFGEEYVKFMPLPNKYKDFVLDKRAVTKKEFQQFVNRDENSH